MSGPLIGWSGRTFRVVFPGGMKTVLSGRRSGIEATLAKVLPAWHRVAVEQGHAEFAAMIAREAEALEICIGSVTVNT